MRRIEIYLDNNGVLTASEFKDFKSKYERGRITGAKVNEFIKNLRRVNLIDIYENKKRQVIALEYKNCVVTLNDSNILLQTKEIKPLIKSINNFYTSEEVKKIGGGKVVRKNKHIPQKIIAGGLATIILSSCAYGFFNKELKIDIDNYLNFKDTIVSKIEDTNKENGFTNVFKEENDFTIQLKDNIDTVSIDYEDRSDTEKAYITKSYYSGLLNKYAKMYGIDPILATAVATQESGIHSSITSPGGATGLMQIQNSVWLNQTVSAYNFETKNNESFTVTFDKIKDVEYNIKIGCMILQNAFQYMKYNTLAAIQCYNMGYGNMMEILNNYAKETNKTVDQILENPEDIGWLNYRQLITQGDQQYIEHVVSWIGDEVNLKNVKFDGGLVDIDIDNNITTKKVY